LVRTAWIMDEHARKVMETGELALGRVNDRIEGMSWDQIAQPEASQFLARLKASLQQVVSIWIADREGRILAGSQPWDRNTGIAERDFFRVHRDRDLGPYISGAFRGKATRQASFAVSRRRVTPDGRFDGTIHISLSPEYFARTYAAIAPDLDHVATLIRAGGEVLVREPAREENAPLEPTSPLMQAIAAHPEGGFTVGHSSLDPVGRAYAYRKVGDYPLYVAIEVPTPLLLDRWYENLTLYGAVAAVASVMLLLVSWLALRRMRAERTALARLRVALQELHHETAQRVSAEQRMRQAEKTEAVGKLTGGVAHDFNNLLTAVLGSLQLMRKRLPQGDERLARLLDNAVRGAERGAALTQRLLAFSRAQVLKPEAIDLAELLSGMAPLLRSSLGVGIEIVTCFPKGLPPAQADTNQLELALLNLALNARDAMPQGGRLVIAAREEHVAEAEGDLRPGSYVVLSLTDTGEGMDEATLARCVEPFFTTKGIGKGTGLGLSMVHGLAAQSGGRLLLRSRKGEGTTAELWLPRAEQGNTGLPLPAAQAEPSKRASGLAVLVVDDDALVLSSAAAMLEDLGYKVLTAPSGMEALAIVRAGTAIDVVVADQAMPGLTGVQLAAELGVLRPGLPVLLATGYAERAELVSSGLPLLDKPFGQSALAAAIGRVQSQAADRLDRVSAA
ncbi:MAG TPA: ATP-binding protein, partial [Acetobacteraceae bacterium]|nr:ATP-binding protein [Acetobacteraceae bacterium]